MNKVPIVFLRGTNWYGREWFLFAKFKEFFEKKNFLVIIPSFYGKTIEENMTSLRSEIKKYGLSKFILVGFSFGGLVAQIYSARYPDEILALVLINSVGKDGVVYAGIILNLAKHLIRGVGSLSLFRIKKNIFYGENFSNTEMLRISIKMHPKIKESIWLWREVFLKGLFAGRQGAGSIVINQNIPIFCVIGEKDGILISDYAVKMAKKINADYSIIYGSGHLLPLEPELWKQAAEKIYNWILEISHRR